MIDKTDVPTGADLRDDDRCTCGGKIVNAGPDGDYPLFCKECGQIWATKAALEGMRKICKGFNKMRDWNASLHLTLFHVENGMSHPDEEITLLIKAAKRARAIDLGEIKVGENSDD